MFINPRNVWKNFIIQSIDFSIDKDIDLQLYINVHQNNTMPKIYQINETTSLVSFSSDDLLEMNVDEKLSILSGKIKYKENLLDYSFSMFDIIQLTDNEINKPVYLQLQKSEEKKSSKTNKQFFKKFRDIDLRYKDI